MEPKNTNYEELLKSIKVAITNSSVYSNNHPLFLESINSLKESLEDIFPSLDPIKIGVALDFLLIEDIRFEEKKLYKDIASFFHQRKIKSIEIQAGVSSQELVDFLSKVNVPIKDIADQGGINSIFAKKNITKIKIEELDYSKFLEKDSKSDKDIWLKLLKENVNARSKDGLNRLEDKFGDMLKNFNLKDFLSVKGSESLINKILTNLKMKNYSKFLEQVTDLTDLASKNPDEFTDDDIRRIKSIFSILNGDDLSKILIEKLKHDDKIPLTHLKLFAKLFDTNQNQNIADSLSHNFKQDDKLLRNPRVVEKIKSLFSLSDDFYLPEIYKKNLSSVLENLSFSGAISFDQKHARANYHTILLNLFLWESDRARLLLILNSILPLLKETNDDYIKRFAKLYKQKSKDISILAELLTKANMQNKGIIEDIFLDRRESTLVFSSLGKDLQEVFFDSSRYMKAIFSKKTPEFVILKLFLNFFPNQINDFIEELEERVKNKKNIRDFVESLIKIDHPLSLEVLKQIFYILDGIMQKDILEGIQNMSVWDEEFLFSILNKASLFHKKYAYLVLVKNSKEKDRLANSLFSISNPFGIRTKVIEDNLRIFIEHPFIEARECLEKLTKYKYFWNRNIRIKARKILSEYGNKKG